METLQEVGHAKTWCGQVQGDLLHAEAFLPSALGPHWTQNFKRKILQISSHNENDCQSQNAKHSIFYLYFDIDFCLILGNFFQAFGPLFDLAGSVKPA